MLIYVHTSIRVLYWVRSLYLDLRVEYNNHSNYPSHRGYQTIPWRLVQSQTGLGVFTVSFACCERSLSSG